MTHDVADRDVARGAVGKPDLAVIAPDLFDRYVPHVDPDPVVADRGGQQTAMHLVGDIEPLLLAVPERIQFAFQRSATLLQPPDLTGL
jgi:hypothetical protein